MFILSFHLVIDNYFQINESVNPKYPASFLFREISRAAGKVNTGTAEDENVGNNTQLMNFFYFISPKLSTMFKVWKQFVWLFLCRALTFVYPYGATLSVMKPAVAILSTGSVCFPLNRPVLAFYQGKVRGQISCFF